MSDKLLCVCQMCGKDMGTIEKPKGAIYEEKKGGFYCEKCYLKKNKLEKR